MDMDIERECSWIMMKDGRRTKSSVKVSIRRTIQRIFSKVNHGVKNPNNINNDQSGQLKPNTPNNLVGYNAHSVKPSSSAAIVN